MLVVLFLGVLSRLDASVTPADLLQDPTPEAWKSLEQFSGTVTRCDFESRLKNIFDPTGSLRPFLKISDEKVEVFSQTNPVTQKSPLATIDLKPSAPAPSPTPSYPITSPTPSLGVTNNDTNSMIAWIATIFTHSSTNPSAPGNAPPTTSSSAIPEQPPLTGRRIVIEPADIGGACGSMEDRSTLYPGFGRIQEGDLNLLVSKILSAKLKELGATVFVTRDQAEPVCGLGVTEVQQIVPQVLAHHQHLLSKTFRSRTINTRESSPIYQKIVSEVLLTKNLEAKARAEKSRNAINPDITIVLQFDATAARHKAGFPKINRNILFISGAYTANEIKNDPYQRLRLLTKLFQNVTPTEISVATSISRHLAEATGFPPVLYGDSWNTRSVPEDRYVVARNLLLSREHDGPVVVTEPYFMNQEETLCRLLAGDFEGTRMIAGKERVSIYREYADAVANGLVEAYGKK